VSATWKTLRQGRNSFDGNPSFGESTSFGGSTSFGESTSFGGFAKQTKADSCRPAKKRVTDEDLDVKNNGLVSATWKTLRQGRNSFDGNPSFGESTSFDGNPSFGESTSFGGFAKQTYTPLKQGRDSFSGGEIYTQGGQDNQNILERSSEWTIVDRRKKGKKKNKGNLMESKGVRRSSRKRKALGSYEAIPIKKERLQQLDQKVKKYRRAIRRLHKLMENIH